MSLPYLSASLFAREWHLNVLSVQDNAVHKNIRQPDCVTPSLAEIHGMMTPRGCLSWLERLCGPVVLKSGKTVDEDEKKIRLTAQSEPEIGNEKEKILRDVAENVARDFEFSDDDIRRAVNGFVKQMNEGLREHGCRIEQLPSFITSMPTGCEKGMYLAVDMGGTNVRVCAVTLNGDGTYSLIQDKVAIPTSLMTAETSTSLFGWVAMTAKSFIETHYPGFIVTHAEIESEKQHVLNLGFTFSHAVHQLGINSGTLIRWSKGFNIDGVVGQDVCLLLQKAFDELALPVRVTALINDTVGTLLARAYTSHPSAETIMGTVFGTGTNGAYIEQESRITKLDSLSPHSKGTMVINSEWGNFDQRLEYLPVTVYDTAMDIGSVNPGFEMFEKRISGMYLGELLRLVILSLLESPNVNIFTGAAIPNTSRLYLQWSLDSSLLSYLESDTSPDLSYSRTQIEQWSGIVPVTFETAQAIQIMAHAIGRRSARLSAIALGAVLVQTDCLSKDDRVDIGADGSLIELYPGFTAEIRRALVCIEKIGEEGEARIDITITKNGSGVGAALAAHIAASSLPC